MDGCFGDVPRTEQPERSNEKKDEPVDTTLFQWSVNQLHFFKVQGTLDGRWDCGESWTISIRDDATETWAHRTSPEQTDREGIRAEHTRSYASRPLVFRLMQPSEWRKITLAELVT